MSPSRVTRNAARSVSSIPGKSQLRWCEITVSSGIRRPRDADRDEARERLGHLHAREPLLARVGVAHDDAEAESDSPEMYGNGWPGADRERGQHRVDLRARSAPRARARSSGVASSTVPTRIPSAASAGHELVPPEPRLRGGQLEHALAHLGERLLRRAAVG